jgi:hypothetical protein
VREDDPEGTAREREYHALRENQAHQTTAARTERGAHGHLSLPRGRAAQHQIGDVGTRDQEDERYRSEEQLHRAPH